MTTDQDLLAALYDRIHQMITFNHQGTPGAGLDADTVVVQMTTNEVLNLATYAGALSGANPEGDLAAAEAFSVFVDKVPSFGGATWGPSDGLAKRYQGIVAGANIDPSLLPNPTQEATYTRLQGLLRKEVKKTNIVTEKEETVVVDSPMYAAYKNAREGYTNALLDAAQVVLDADLSTNFGKRQANVDKRKADAVVKARFDDWIAAGKSDVDELLGALESLKNSAISAAIKSAKSVMDDAKWLASNSEAGQPWMLATAAPSNWTEPSCRGSILTLSSDTLKTNTNTTATSYANNSRGWFWWGSSSDTGSTETKDVTLASQALTLSAELVLVRVQRPWLNELLFTMKGWSNNGYPDAGSISNAKGGGALPGIPIAFLMARNVKISAKFSSTDSKFIQEQSQKTSRHGWGWGPFGAGDATSKSDSKGDQFSSTGDQLTLSFASPQVIAWVSRLVPICPR